MMIAGTELRRQGCSLQDGKQWGNLWAGYTEVLNWYFPLTTSQVYAVCLTKHTKNISSGHNWEPARIEEWNNSYARIHPDGDLGYSVIAICKAQQQWGFTVFDPAYYKNVNFTLPLSVNGTFCAFSTGYDAKGSTFLWHSMSHFNNVNVGVTGFVFDSRYTFTGLGYLAVCWQKQWGFTNNTGRPYITFPFKFSNVFTAISCICHNGSPSEANTVYNVSISGMNIGASGGGSGKYWCAFGVAQQQWGYGNSESTQTFPIKFTNSVIGIYGSKRAINYEYTFAATSITNTNFFMSTRNSEGSSRVIACNWLAIGQQQTK